MSGIATQSGMFVMANKATTGNIGYYKLDGDFNDSSGSGSNGTSSGSPVFISDSKFGQVLNLDGIDDRVDLGSVTTFRNNSWSISMWIKTPATTNTVPIMGKNNGDTGFSFGERVIEISGSGTWAALINPEPAGNLVVNGHSLGGVVTNQSAVELDDGNWHMITIVHDNSISSTDITMYIDSVSYAKGSQSFNNNTADDVGNVYLGFSNKSNGGAGYFEGEMAEVNFFDYPIDSTVVSGLYTMH